MQTNCNNSRAPFAVGLERCCARTTKALSMMAFPGKVRMPSDEPRIVGLKSALLGSFGSQVPQLFLDDRWIAVDVGQTSAIFAHEILLD